MFGDKVNLKAKKDFGYRDLASIANKSSFQFSVPNFLATVINHLTSSPYDGVLENLTWGLSSLTRLPRLSSANIPTLKKTKKEIIRNHSIKNTQKLLTNL